MRDFGFYEKFGYKLGLHDVTTKKNSEMQTFVKLEDFKKKKNYKQCVSSTLQYQREALVKTTVSSQRSREGGRGESFGLTLTVDLAVNVWNFPACQYCEVMEWPSTNLLSKLCFLVCKIGVISSRKIR